MLLTIGTSNGICAEMASIFQLVGKILMIFKILLPVLLIIFGILDLGKAVIASDSNTIKKAVSTLIKRFLLAIAIFFLPLIISVLFNLINSFHDTEADYEVCKSCITNPTATTPEKNGCADYVEMYSKE